MSNVKSHMKWLECAQHQKHFHNAIFILHYLVLWDVPFSVSSIFFSFFLSFIFVHSFVRSLSLKVIFIFFSVLFCSAMGCLIYSSSWHYSTSQNLWFGGENWSEAHKKEFERARAFSFTQFACVIQMNVEKRVILLRDGFSI